MRQLLPTIALLFATPLSAQLTPYQESRLHPHKWHLTWSAIGTATRPCGQFADKVLPEQRVTVVRSVLLHFDLLHRISEHWEVGAGYLQSTQRVSGFIHQPYTDPNGQVYYTDNRQHGDGFGLEQHYRMVGALVSYAPFTAARKRQRYATVKFIGGLWHTRFTEAQIIAPGYAYYSPTLNDLLRISVRREVDYRYPAGWTPNATQLANTLMVELSARAELHLGRVFSVTMDLGGYLAPAVHIDGCSTTNATGDALVIPPHKVRLTRGLFCVGAAIHFG